MKLQEVKLCFSSAGVNTDWLAWSALTQASSGTWCLLALPEAQIINSFFFPFSLAAHLTSFIPRLQCIFLIWNWTGDITVNPFCV